MSWHVSNVLLTQLMGHEIGSNVQSALTDRNKVPNMVATVNCRKIFCGLKNRIFLKMNRLSQKMWGSWGGGGFERKVLHFQLKFDVSFQ
jgi:hypothetical protein